MRNRAFADLPLATLLLAIVLFLHLPSFGDPTVQAEPEKFRLGFLIGDGMTTSVNNAIRKLYQERPELKGKIEVEVLSRKRISELGPETFHDVPILFLDIMVFSVNPGMEGALDPESIQQILSGGTKILSVNYSAQSTEFLESQGFDFDERVREYWGHKGVDNLKNMVLYTLTQYGNFEVDDVKGPAPKPYYGIYHPKKEDKQFFDSFDSFRQWYGGSGNLKEGKPWIALLFYRAYFNSAETEIEDQIIEKLEERGYNAFAGFGYPAGQTVDRFLIDPNGKPRVNAVLSFLFRFPGEKNYQSLVKLGVPVMNMISLFDQSKKEWSESEQGLTIFENSFQIAIPEISGLIQPLVAASNEPTVDEITGFEVHRKLPIPERVDRALDRVDRWITLQNKPNSEKVVGMIYYNFPPGKNNIGASYLNAVESISSILKRMGEEGFRVGSVDQIDPDVLLENILRYGRNVGNWAPGEVQKMVDTGKCTLIPVEEYRTWLNEIHPVLKEQVLRDWGPPEKTDVMTWTDPKTGNRYIVIPAVRSGNVVLLPQPIRGWSQNPEKMMHQLRLAPHHQYMATYLWLHHKLKADAIIHVGTHGTLEWLEGKGGGLDDADAPEALIRDLPNIYPYVVDDVGEGLVAKRRGAAVIVDHQIPPLKKSEIYHEYAELQELINDHHEAEMKSPQLAREYKNQIIEKINELGINTDLEIDGILEKEGLTHELLHGIGEYLDEIRQIQMPYGFHTFGEVHPPENRGGTVEAILEVDKDLSPEKRVNVAKELDQKLVQSSERELQSLVDGLNGEFIPTGTGNDPVRNPNSLPTGKNFYAFDPNRVPKKAAYEIGKELTISLIDQYRRKNEGKYPDKLSFVIWGTETIRHEGVIESQVFYTLGTRPVWDERGILQNVEIIPREELGRPRIDILISSAAEGVFPKLTVLMDKAVQMVKELDEPDNYIRQHYLELKEELVKIGYSEEKAAQYAGVRIFDEPPGVYNLNTSTIAASSATWDDSNVLAQDYIRKMSYGYGNGLWGEPMEDVYKKILSGTDMVVHSRSSNLYGTLDNDDFFMYAGGLAKAVDYLDGKTPDLMVSNLMNPANPKAEPINRVMGTELRSRYLNPKWIQGMKEEGFEGANEMSKFVEYLWGWQVTVPYTVDDAKWNQIYEVYVEDKYDQGMKEFFDRENPWAYQVMTARMLETIRKEYWDADEKTIQTLAKELANSVATYGVACNENTCANPYLTEMVIKTVSVPGVMDPKTVEKFESVLNEATGSPLQALKEKMDRLKRELSKVTETAPGEERDQEPLSGDLQKVKGYEMEDIEQPIPPAMFSSSQFTMILILTVLTFLALVVYGYRSSRIRS